MRQPAPVVPEDIRLIPAAQLLHLRIALPLHLRRALWLPQRIKISRETPVHRRIVKSDVQPRLPAGIRVLPHKIPVRPDRLARKLPPASRAVPQSKSVVVARHHHHIPRAELFCQRDPLSRVKRLRGKLIRQLLILPVRDLLVEFCPLPVSLHGIKSPVHKHPYFAVRPPSLVLRRQRQLLTAHPAETLKLDTAF